MVKSASHQAKTKTIKEQMSSRRWRINNLYHIIDELSRDIVFKLATRPVLEQFFNSMWFWNLILKSRQHGITTLIDLFMLDACLFNDNVHAGIIAHDLKSAQRIFYNKIKYPYDHLPKSLQNCRILEKADSMELRMSNGSSIWVGTSMRSSTLRMLHVSEHAKICAKYPEKAREIMTGALPTLHEGSYLFIESTAEGAAGDFYETAQVSRQSTTDADKAGRKLNPQEIRFHFFGWQQHPGNTTNPVGIKISDSLMDYFSVLEGREGIKLTPGQMAWYSLKKDGPAGLGRYMKREHATTPEEAFEQSVEGAVYSEELEDARNDGRIGFYPWDKTAQVYTFWDVGYGDKTSVIFAQFLKDQVRVIDHYSLAGRGAAYHAAQVKNKEYIYADHFGPHDIMNHEKGSGIVLKDTYDSLLGMIMKVVERPKLKADGIDAVRAMFNKVVFNEKTTRDLVKALSFYRYEWDPDKACFKKDPLHDWASDDADAMQTMAMQYRYGTIGNELLGYPHAIPVRITSGAQGRGQKYDRLRNRKRD